MIPSFDYFGYFWRVLDENLIFSSTPYFDPSDQSETVEERHSLPELDDVKLRRTNPKRYDIRTDQYYALGESGSDSSISNRYDNSIQLEGTKKVSWELFPDPNDLKTYLGWLVKSTDENDPHPFGIINDVSDKNHYLWRTFEVTEELAVSNIGIGFGTIITTPEKIAPLRYIGLSSESSQTLEELDWEIDQIVKSSSQSLNLFNPLIFTDKLLQRFACSIEVLPYESLPSFIHTFIANRFSDVYDQVKDILDSLYIEFTKRPDSYNGSIGAEYVPQTNSILYYLDRDTLPEHWGGIVHEIVHAIQEKLQGQVNGISFPPDNTKPDYLNLGEGYRVDSGEEFARQIEEEFNKVSKKLSWKVFPDPEDPESYIGWLIKCISHRVSPRWIGYVVVTAVKRYPNSPEDTLIEGLWGESIEEAKRKYITDEGYFTSMPLGDAKVEIIPLEYIGPRPEKESSLKFSTDYIQKNQDMFQSRYDQYGEDGPNIFWSGKEAQEKRFEVLSHIGNLNDKSVLDVGAGYGDFLTYLESKNIRPSLYTGIDIVKDIIEIAKEKHPNTTFEVRNVVENPYPENSFNYVFGSGIFALEGDDWENYVVQTLQAMYKTAKVGVGVNFLKADSSLKLSWQVFPDPEDPKSYIGWLVKDVSTSHTPFGVIFFVEPVMVKGEALTMMYAHWEDTEEEALTSMKLSGKLARWAYLRSLAPIRYIGLPPKTSSQSLKYVHPDEVVKLVKESVTKSVVLVEGYVKDDFTLFLYKR